MAVRSKAPRPPATVASGVELNGTPACFLGRRQRIVVVKGRERERGMRIRKSIVNLKRLRCGGFRSTTSVLRLHIAPPTQPRGCIGQAGIGGGIVRIFIDG